ncbi:TPA: hypothetical protein NGR23_002487 [Vibrio parahaemolyticus]|nr:hypothetical protein [Vibrio parahaemolyticus]HCM0447025.1 hypothetical protein [Vibrio parahaemolyticus]
MKVSDILDYFKNHPLLVVTISTLSCAIIGFWLEFTLLYKFGLNVGTFASIDYFLLAGVTSPQVLVIFIALALSNLLKMKILTQFFPMTDKNAHIHTFWRQVIFIALLVIAANIIYENSSKKYQTIVSNPEQYASVLLRTNNAQLSDKANDLTLITATDAFMIFYQHSTSAVIATPTENISAVSIINKNILVDVPK